LKKTKSGWQERNGRKGASQNLRCLLQTYNVTILVGMTLLCVAANDTTPMEISAKAMANRSGGPVERRKLQKNEECGFLPKAATPVLQRFPMGLKPVWDRFPRVVR